MERDKVIGRSKSVHIPSLPSCPTGWAITCALLAAQKFVFPPPSGVRLFARPILFMRPYKHNGMEQHKKRISLSEVMKPQCCSI
jgi:hypothetical protein